MRSTWPARRGDRSSRSTAPPSGWPTSRPCSATTSRCSMPSSCNTCGTCSRSRLPGGTGFAIASRHLPTTASSGTVRSRPAGGTYRLHSDVLHLVVGRQQLVADLQEQPKGHVGLLHRDHDYGRGDVAAGIELLDQGVGLLLRRVHLAQRAKEEVLERRAVGGAVRPAGGGGRQGGVCGADGGDGGHGRRPVPAAEPRSEGLAVMPGFVAFAGLGRE